MWMKGKKTIEKGTEQNKLLKVVPGLANADISWKIPQMYMYAQQGVHLIQLQETIM